jgi:hypothetical protein
MGKKENKMSYKFCPTDWIAELGRYAIIISTRKDDRNLEAEALVFALDTAPFFGGKRLTYAYDGDIRPPLDEEFMHKMALDQAKGIISLQKEEAYRRTMNLDIYQLDSSVGQTADTNSKTKKAESDDSA